MEVAGPLGTPLGLAQQKRASPRGEAPDWIRVPGTNSLGSINLLEWLAELREIFYLLDYLFIIKGYSSGTTRYKRCIEKGEKRQSRAILNLQVFTNPEAPKTPSFQLSLMEVLLNRCDQSVHCLMVTETQSLDPPSPHLESDGVELKISTL